MVQAIQTYAMSCFKLPKGFCQELEKRYGGDNRLKRGKSTVLVENAHVFRNLEVGWSLEILRPLI